MHVLPLNPTNDKISIAMQPIDALTIKAICQELNPLVASSRLNKIQQSGRDELVLTLYARAKTYYLLLSANSQAGRLCLIGKPKPEKLKTQSAFSLSLRKHLNGAHLIDLQQVPGERIINLTFLATDELGRQAKKILTAEIMGKHSNLIFIDEASMKIIAASHNVSQDMSSVREVASGLRYVAPPRPSKPNIFTTDKGDIVNLLSKFDRQDQSIEDLLLTHFSGLGRSLASEIGQASKTSNLPELLEALKNTTQFSPKMATDLSTYTVLGWLAAYDTNRQWQEFTSVSEMIATYYELLAEARLLTEACQKLQSEISREQKKLQAKTLILKEQIEVATEFAQHKHFGDLILAHINEIPLGQPSVTLSDFLDDGKPVEIALDDSLSPSQNAQRYYRRYTKDRLKVKSAKDTLVKTSNRLEVLSHCLNALAEIDSLSAIPQIRQVFSGRQADFHNQENQSKLSVFISSDGLTIQIGRNRKENDQIVSEARAHDIWLHVAHGTGSHVILRMPKSKDEPPKRSLAEAAFAAAYFSKAKTSGIVRVFYTQCKHLKKLGRPGLVSYSQEKTVEVDLNLEPPQAFKTQFC